MMALVAQHEQRFKEARENDEARDLERLEMQKALAEMAGELNRYVH